VQTTLFCCRRFALRTNVRTGHRRINALTRTFTGESEIGAVGLWLGQSLARRATYRKGRLSYGPKPQACLCANRMLWYGGWVWRDVIPGLRNLGNALTAPTLTGLDERRHNGIDDTDLIKTSIIHDITRV
jgi:hypothetical protein